MQAKVFKITDEIYRISIVPTNNFMANFEFNHFLIIDERPVLVHTGRSSWFSQLREQVSELINLEKLAYIVFSHFEADECGSLNKWLQAAPNALPITNKIGRASIEEFSIRKPKIVKDGQKINLGKHELLVIETPHFPHNWDAMLYFETKEKVLFSSDLGAHLGAGEPQTEEDLSEDIAKFQRSTGFMAEGPSLVRAIDKIEKLDIHYLATQHGSTLKGKNIKYLLERLKMDFGFTPK